jgi:hypothetical protein
MIIDDRILTYNWVAILESYNWESIIYGGGLLDYSHGATPKGPPLSTFDDGYGPRVLMEVISIEFTVRLKFEIFIEMIFYKI